MIIKYYSRQDCLLCEEGFTVLKLVQEELHFDIEIINIEENDQMHEKYMLMIPVVECNGEVVQYGNLDYVSLYEGLAKN
ncbi:glutaredoxin family protein [Butyricicoccus sp. 1XD8-22]|nr:glutaredoxin family protein [Butyricicoccus sp. 1XD8-22]